MARIPLRYLLAIYSNSLQRSISLLSFFANVCLWKLMIYVECILVQFFVSFLSLADLHINFLNWILRLIYLMVFYMFLKIISLFFLTYFPLLSFNLCLNSINRYFSWPYLQLPPPSKVWSIYCTLIVKYYSLCFIFYFIATKIIFHVVLLWSCCTKFSWLLEFSVI